ncbi:DsbA family protein [Pseudonocardia sp. RS010]|uniref:DsbA family protein n=1 Tax=Pseudonocardia sp. RS010 TaxID=3385979 RepID=UPI0039A1072C
MPSGSATRRRKNPVTARRGPSPWVIVAVVVLVLFAGGIGYAVYSAQRSAGEVAVPAGGSETGITVGQAAAPATIDLYVDFQCPACKQYEEQVGPTIDRLVDAGEAKVVYHPVAFLNRFSSTEYSTRSSSAAACAADAGVFPQYAKTLFANQPPENSAGLPDEQLVALGQQVGAGEDFARCVQGDTYEGWTASVTEAASRAGVNATPTVQVDGAEIERTTDALVAAVQAAQR